MTGYTERCWAGAELVAGLSLRALAALGQRCECHQLDVRTRHAWSLPSAAVMEGSAIGRWASAELSDWKKKPLEDRTCCARCSDIDRTGQLLFLIAGADK